MLEKDTRIVIRCNHSHKTQWEKEAREAGLTLSDYVRTVLMVVKASLKSMKQHK